MTRAMDLLVAAALAGGVAGKRDSSPEEIAKRAVAIAKATAAELEELEEAETAPKPKG